MTVRATIRWATARPQRHGDRRAGGQPVRNFAESRADRRHRPCEGRRHRADGYRPAGSTGADRTLHGALARGLTSSTACAPGAPGHRAAVGQLVLSRVQLDVAGAHPRECRRLPPGRPARRSAASAARAQPLQERPVRLGASIPSACPTSGRSAPRDRASSTCGGCGTSPRRPGELSTAPLRAWFYVGAVTPPSPCSTPSSSSPALTIAASTPGYASC